MQLDQIITIISCSQCIFPHLRNSQILMGYMRYSSASKAFSSFKKAADFIPHLISLKLAPYPHHVAMCGLGQVTDQCNASFAFNQMYENLYMASFAHFISSLGRPPEYIVLQGNERLSINQLSINYQSMRSTN